VLAWYQSPFYVASFVYAVVGMGCLPLYVAMSEHRDTAQNFEEAGLRRSSA